MVSKSELFPRLGRKLNKRESQRYQVGAKVQQASSLASRNKKPPRLTWLRAFGAEAFWTAVALLASTFNQAALAEHAKPHF